MVQGRHKSPTLTPKELEAFKYLAEGKKYADIAMIVNRSVDTIRHHLWSGANRIGAETVLHAAILLVKQGKI